MLGYNHCFPVLECNLDLSLWNFEMRRAIMINYKNISTGRFQ